MGKSQNKPKKTICREFVFKHRDQLSRGKETIKLIKPKVVSLTRSEGSSARQDEGNTLCFLSPTECTYRVWTDCTDDHGEL